MYKVIKDFTDAQDKHTYFTGDTYPREGVTPSKERIAELASTDNKRGEILIEEVKPKKTKKSPAKKKKE